MPLVHTEWFARLPAGAPRLDEVTGPPLVRILGRGAREVRYVTGPGGGAILGLSHRVRADVDGVRLGIGCLAPDPDFAQEGLFHALRHVMEESGAFPGWELLRGTARRRRFLPFGARR
ncbi:hypothetical protein ACQEU5_15270 [Marinactinospora thermotolerans]|uniref:Uncharacterized protein n=1 Tax=Marinactinospora thermotolerans DSM 45154 TaxID=1122192 RepID=A0A1T4RKE1_9ACTN|nr:hypothetical protein [Marinactinospora thermotolerans]SKA16399.1 hypothetical protein SAMN02745673_02762 [Marinactinospora thermotolerans DSM 45154]